MRLPGWPHSAHASGRANSPASTAAIARGCRTRCFIYSAASTRSLDGSQSPLSVVALHTLRVLRSIPRSIVRPAHPLGVDRVQAAWLFAGPLATDVPHTPIIGALPALASLRWRLLAEHLASPGPGHRRLGLDPRLLVAAAFGSAHESRTAGASTQTPRRWSQYTCGVRSSLSAVSTMSGVP